MTRFRVLAMGLVDGLRGLWLRLHGVRSLTIQTEQGAMRMLEVNGSGSLPPMLMVHGLSSAAVDWGPVILRMKKHSQRIRALDLPGHGGSDMPRDGMGLEPMRSMILEASETVFDQPQIVVGNSMGGLAAVRMAAQQPDQTLALILISPGGSPVGSEGLSAIMDRFEMDSWAKAHSFVDAFTGGPNRRRFDIAWGIRARMSRPSVRALVNRISTADLLEPKELQELQMPILLVWGQDDEILDSEHLEFYRRNLHEGTEIHTPEGMGHSPFLDRMEHFVELMLEFCGRVDPKST